MVIPTPPRDFFPGKALSIQQHSEIAMKKCLGISLELSYCQNCSNKNCLIHLETILMKYQECFHREISRLLIGVCSRIKGNGHKTICNCVTGQININIYFRNYCWPLLGDNQTLSSAGFRYCRLQPISRTFQSRLTGRYQFLPKNEISAYIQPITLFSVH